MAKKLVAISENKSFVMCLERKSNASEFTKLYSMAYSFCKMDNKATLVFPMSQ